MPIVTPSSRVAALLLAAPLWSGCALFTLMATERSHPMLEGAADAPGAEGSLRLVRDDTAVVHVRAESERDAWYGLGFAHAQDRLFQADFNRHVAHGRMAEWFGERAVPLDHFVRSMHLADRGRRSVAGSDPATRAMLEAYTAGLNDGVASLPALPVEYRLLGLEFDEWSPEDCTAVGYLQSWNLAGNPRHELAALLLPDVDADTLDALFRVHPSTPPVDAFWDELRTVELGEFNAGFLGFTGALGGRPDPTRPLPSGDPEASNNWVVGSDRTASGMPIVANDPHLTQGVPSLWYLADVQGGDLHVAGATLPGSPGFPVGHSERVAWGLTNVMADVVDFVVLERDGDEHYVLAGERKRLRRVPVHTRPKDELAVSGEVWWTEVGPVVTELEGTHLVAMQWHALQLEDRLHEVLHGLSTATSVADARSAARKPLMVAQNVAIADVEGAWGWQVVGSIPVRRAHTGRVPYPGSDPAQGWSGWQDDLPRAMEPEAGFVVTANSRPDHPQADAISTAYVPPHRYDRIVERLDTLDAATPADLHDVQLDLREMGAVRHLDRLLEGIEPGDGPGATCHRLLTEWDREATADSAGAAVWALFQREVVRHALEDELGERGTSIVMQVASTGRSPLDGELDRFVQDRERTVRYALQRACVELTSRLGEDPALWTWGALHPLKLEHPFARRAPVLLRGWNMDPVPFGGSGTTVAAAGYSWTRDDLRVGGMASLRIVMPLDDLAASTLVHPGGQSGMPRHGQFASHYVHFVNGGTLPLYFDDDDVEQHAVTTLVLSP
jgi:penicillin amidase